MQVEHPGDEGALQARPRPAEYVEAAARDVNALLEVDDAKLLAELPVRLSGEIEFGLIAPLFGDDVVLFAAGGDPRRNIERLYYVKQKMTTLKHATGPLLEFAGKLFGGRVPQVCSGLSEYFRDVHDHLVRLNQTIDSARDTVATAIQVNLAMITIGESEVTKRLAAYAALVAVPTMVAGVYGMNFEHMPELKWAFGYPFAIAIMVAVDAWLFWRFRKAGWL